MANKQKDEKGITWEKKCPNTGQTIQGNFKTFDGKHGEHKWFNTETGKMGCAGENAERKKK